MGRAGTIARRSFLIGSAAIAGGVAFGVWRFHTPYANPLQANLPEGAAALTPYVLITEDAITLITPRADSGQGAVSVQAALIAEELDVDLDQVATDPGPPSPPTGTPRFRRMRCRSAPPTRAGWPTRCAVLPMRR